MSDKAIEWIEDEVEEEEVEVRSPLKAIRKFCVECMGGNRVEVKACTSPKCPLYAFRMGKNPYNKKVLTEEQKAEVRERLLAAREKKNNS